VLFLSGFILGTGITLFSFALPYAFGVSNISISGLNSSFVLHVFLFYGLAWLGVAAIEEIIFRGYLLQTLKAGLGALPALLITSILFGAGHLAGGLAPAPSPPAPILAFVDTGMLGLLMGIGYLRSGTLWLPIGLHFAINFSISQILSAPLTEQLRNGSLSINHQSQLLNAHWPLSGLTLSMTDYLVDVVIYAVAIGLLLLWRFKPIESTTGPSHVEATEAS
jgi:membrane protease YdiL (CAAX protease family)